MKKNRQDGIKHHSLWTRLGCFLTGYNCNLLRQCSEASYKKLHKYTAALLILTVIWGSIGFSLAWSYFSLPVWAAILVGLVFIVIVIQVERQIIMTVGRNFFGTVARVVLGLVMAVLGSVILDQILFAEDIKKEKEEVIQADVDKVVSLKSGQIDRRLAELDSMANVRDTQVRLLAAQIARKPYIAIYDASVTKDSTGKTIKRTIQSKRVINPKIDELKTIRAERDSIYKQRKELIQQKMQLRDRVENDLKNRKGFLYDLKIMRIILQKNKEALGVWLFWFVFLFFLELFVILTKLTDRRTDYDVLVEEMQKLREGQFKSQNIPDNN